ncbi:MAG: arginine--tRNA ligase [Candidatus Marinimicrobia bacterium]|nr:arginine--tRNA ligase [Candidatus Neomarinimicrobiota bacterium]
MKDKLIHALEEVLTHLDYPDVDVMVQLPKNPDHGDFSTNIAMQLSRKLGENPREIAEVIRTHLCDHYSDLLESADIAGPGFINFTLKSQQLISQIELIISKGNQYGKSEIGVGKTAQVEFVSANPTGPLTVGHGRGAILGDVVSNILQWNGYSVHREYYYNNAGRQMQRLGESVKARYAEICGDEVEFPENGYEGEYIIDIAKELQQTQGDTLIQSEDNKTFRKAAETTIFTHIEKTLQRLGLQFDEFFNEQSLYDSGAIDNFIQDLKAHELIYEKEGATWFKATAAGRVQDRVIIKSTGEPTYRLPDMAYHQNKLDRGFDLVIDILGADHMDAYPDVVAAVGKLGYDTNRIKVIIHQFVTLTDGGEPVKMSTRKANFITLDELIDEVGADVVRYFFIMRGNNSHLNFDLKLAKDESDENPVFYLQYAHARLCNILKHAEGLGHPFNSKADTSLLNNPLEVKLIKNLLEFPNVVKKGHETLEPQTIANYLQQIAALFHKYYANERVVTEDTILTSARLILVKATQIVMKNGLTILGVTAPKRM